MKRKLPVYFLINTSAAMAGKPILSTLKGIELILSLLKKEASIFPEIHVGIIEYNTEARSVVEMSRLTEVAVPVLNTGGATALGAGLDLLSECIEHDVRKPDLKEEIKGDWKTIVFHFSDGYPTDDWVSSLNRLNKRNIHFILSFGIHGAKIEVLERVSGHPDLVVDLDESIKKEMENIRKYLIWGPGFYYRNSPADSAGTYLPGCSALPKFDSDLDDLF